MVVEMIKELKHSLKTFFSNKTSALIATVIDLAHFFVFASLFAGFATVVLEHLEKVSEIMASGSQDVMSELEIVRGVRDFIDKQPQFVEHYFVIAEYFVYIMLTAYACWMIFQGVNWWLANRASGNKENFWRYCLKFFLLNIIVLFILTIIIYIPIFISMIDVFAFLTIITQFFARLVFYIAFAVLVYFAGIAYALIAKHALLRSLKQAFIIGFTRWKELVPAYIIDFVVLYALVFIILFFRESFLAMFLITILLFLPTAFWIRILIAEIVNKK